MNKKREAILHGECIIKAQAVIPEGAKRKEIKDNFVVVAPSETTGNHHVVDVHPGVEFFDGPDNTLFMKNSKSTQVRCIHADRHDAIEIPAGTYEFGSQKEYDYFEQVLRNVAD